MSLFENPENIQLLRNLLNPEQDADKDTDFEEEEEPLVKHNFIFPDPGSIGPSAKSKAKKSSKAPGKSPYDPLDTTATLNKQPKTLEEWEKLNEQEDAELLEQRKCPSYTMTYRQAVGTEDVFLQMGNRTNATASCEDLVVDISLPDDDTPVDKMQLNITESELTLSTPIYHLKLPLVHKVNVDRCRAKYQAEQHKLTLTLRLQRELDFVNF